MKFKPKQLPQLTYKITVSLARIPDMIVRYRQEQEQFGYKLYLYSKFQRSLVWTKDQQVKFLEWVLKGGDPGFIIFNHPRFQSDYESDMWLVDGLQRLTTINKFVNHELRAYGYFIDEFDNYVNYIPINIAVGNVSYKEMLQWYIDLNSGGTPHTKEDIDKVERLLETI